MKRKLILLLFLIVLFVLVVIVKYIIFDIQNTDGQLRIVSSPSSSIFINSIAIGKVPFDVKYKAGEYALKLIPEATATATWQRKIKINKKAITHVNFELGSTDLSTAGVVLNVIKSKTQTKKDTGELLVESDPPNALIYLDNDEKGVSLLELTDIPKGDHELAVFMPGFIRHIQKINISSGYKILAYVKLAIDPSQNPPIKNEDEYKASQSANLVKDTSSGLSVTIKGTPDGWLRVRTEPSVNASEAARVNEGDLFELLEEKSGWYKIKYNGTNDGWISAVYTEKK